MRSAIGTTGVETPMSVAAKQGSIDERELVHLQADVSWDGRFDHGEVVITESSVRVLAADGRVVREFAWSSIDSFEVREMVGSGILEAQDRGRRPSNRSLLRGFTAAVRRRRRLPQQAERGRRRSPPRPAREGRLPQVRPPISRRDEGVSPLPQQDAGPFSPLPGGPAPPLASHRFRRAFADARRGAAPRPSDQPPLDRQRL